MTREILRNDTIEATRERLKALYGQENLDPGTVLKIGVKPQWNVIIGTNGQCGIAINFTGKHAVYGEAAGVEAIKLRSLVGKSLFDIAEKNISPGAIQERSVGIAAMSALSQPLLKPISLKKRGFYIQDWTDFQGDKGSKGSIADFVRADDIVAIVGYGGIVRKVIGKCKEIHVTEMRPRENFQTVIIAENVDYGPQKVAIHSEEENEEVLSNADVVVVTGSSLVNNTFDELMDYTANARLVGMYGPSASLIPDVLFERGVDFISSYQIIDPVKFEDSMINDIDMEMALKEHQSGYVVQSLPEKHVE